jgi:DNA polymerase-3 subunit beta
MPGDSVTLSVDERYNATIESGASNFSLCALRGADFPNLPILSGERGFRIGAAILKKMLGKVIHSVGEAQESRPMLGGVFMKVEEGNIEVVSCDSITLSVCRRACDVEDIGAVVSASFSFIIPAHALQSLMRILPDAEEESVTVYLTRKHAIFRFDDLTFFTRLIDGEYIDYNRILPKDQTIFLKIKREVFLQSLERAMLVAEEKFAGAGRSYVKLTVRDGVLIVTSSSANGKIYDELECECKGGEIEIGFNCRLLLNSVRASDSEELLVTLKSPLTSITVEPAEKTEDKDFFYMVLPVRMAE